jgi:hypothetical protein
LQRSRGLLGRKAVVVAVTASLWGVVPTSLAQARSEHGRGLGPGASRGVVHVQSAQLVDGSQQKTGNPPGAPSERPAPRPQPWGRPTSRTPDPCLAARTPPPGASRRARAIRTLRGPKRDQGPLRLMFPLPPFAALTRRRRWRRLPSRLCAQAPVPRHRRRPTPRSPVTSSPSRCQRSRARPRALTRPRPKMWDASRRPRSVSRQLPSPPPQLPRGGATTAARRGKRSIATVAVRRGRSAGPRRSSRGRSRPLPSLPSRNHPLSRRQSRTSRRRVRMRD